MQVHHPSRRWLAPLLIIGIVAAGPFLFGQAKKALTFQDVMTFKALRNPSISDDGRWVAFAAQPDRGDGEVRIRGVSSDKLHVIERGANPVLSKDSRWAACIVRPSAVDLEKPAKDRPKQGMALLNLGDGRVTNIANVERFSFSDDAKWLAYKLYKEEKKEEKKETEKPAEGEKTLKLEEGTDLILRNLSSGKEERLPFVTSFTFDDDSGYLVYAVAHPDGRANGVFRRTLAFTDLPEASVIEKERGSFTNLTWLEDEPRLAFLAGIQDDEGKVASCSLWIWDGKAGEAAEVVPASAAPEGWIIPPESRLNWTKDGKRLFFGLKPEEADESEKPDSAPEEKELTMADLFDEEKILADRGVDVWHWDDPLINTHQKAQWNRQRNRTFTAVYHFDSGTLVQLADQDMPDISVAENPESVLGFSALPYQKEITWDGTFQDVYVVDLADGRRTKILSHFQGRPNMSPDGSHVAYFIAPHWHLYDVRTGESVNLTADLDIPFANEDHDTPSTPRGYGVAGWLEDGSAVFIYDKFDIWQFDTSTGKALNLTDGAGRADHIVFRILRLDRDEPGFTKGQDLLLSSYRDLEKNHGFYAARIGKPGVEKRLEELKKFSFLAKAEDADALLYTRESFEEFPDLWVAGSNFASPRKVTDLNPQIKDFAWGSAELVEWTSVDGVPLQGVLIKPGNYEEGKRYPVIIYFYELFSQRLYEFNQIVVNHRPCFPYYTSNGYALFLPDVRFKVGHPGQSSLKCIVPGAQKLIDMGVADPNAIGIHGHSWSGYETAYIITQTDFFTCAISGAPVSNMTSAYSGIRWESGLARQFQYEKTQSRIGGSLWEKPELYLENSPVFFADRVQTPVLIMHGDEDGAVPWYQSIEFYLALRRLEKDSIFLQYRGEPHHPQKYANKLDYSIRMKQYFDHYLKGMPAPDWITKGVPYNGK